MHEDPTRVGFSGGQAAFSGTNRRFMKKSDYEVDPEEQAYRSNVMMSVDKSADAPDVEAQSN